MSDKVVILHHYEVSPFSEKLRLALDLKGIKWQSCIHSWILPRPGLNPELLGEYRRIPVLQIGADFFCDSVRAIPALDELFPEKPLNANGIGLWNAIYHVTDFKGMFQYLVNTMPWTKNIQTENKKWAADVQSKEFIEDRNKMFGGEIPVDAMAAGLPMWRDQLVAFLDTIESSIKGSKTGWLMGTEEPGAVDVHMSNPVWFMREQKTNPDIYAAFPAVDAWLTRLQAAAQKNRHPDSGNLISTEDATKVAESHSKSENFVPLGAFNDFNGRKEGQKVVISSDELRGSGRSFVTGPLLESSAQRITVGYTTPHGFVVRHHYPRHGYDVLPASE